MAKRNMVSYIKEITASQNLVDYQLERVAAMEKKLKRQGITEEERGKLEEELADVKQCILKQQTELRNYYGENRKSFTFSVLLMFFAFLFYGLYVMIYGPKS